MGRIKKKGTAGQAKNFITRTQAVRKLQISLPDFRKLCIWKGIYPREPRSKKKASKSSSASTTFYYTKDIQYLLHEPLLQKFREQKALEKKISKALGRGDAHDASRLERNASRPEKTGRTKYTLDHVIRERYPTFIDALRDLDDCLSMLFLFANLPSTDTVPAKMIARCERLCLEFEHYLIMSNSLRKSFLSIKGIYYQATIQGQDILWLVPYRFNQRVTGDVDFRIMGTFVEFYQTLLGFVNFRLYTSVGLVYPPKFDKNRDDQGAELGAFSLEGNGVGAIEQPKPITNGENSKPDPKLQAEIDKLMAQLNQPEKEAEQELPTSQTLVDGDEEQPTDTIDKFEPAAPGGDILLQPSYSATDPSTLFSNFTFFLSRETPRQPLEFILKAFGCKRIGWDAVLGDGAYTHNELDPSITHQVVDRPPIQIDPEAVEQVEDNQTAQKLSPGSRVPGRIYIQPQWIWDSVNDEELKRPDLYGPGAQLPPHLSPFVKKVRGQYDPSAPLNEQEREDEELEADSDMEEDISGEDDMAVQEPKFLTAMEVDATAEGMDIAGSEDDESEDADVVDNEDDDFGGFSDVEDEDEDEAADSALQRQRELEAELTGVALEEKVANPKADAKKKAAKRAKEEDEELERAKMMMSRKKRKILEKMVYSNKKKDGEAEALRAKRRKIEKSGKGAPRA
ncbi:Pescadillo-like protein [Lachnellula hyalina]|uniref:Pescadillo homolog n=1 Tax=Lachnellula hyalina TaxID=1316788 RepID=A0A8H8R735_9HELO|nr:Pescadillo-like protein [Lachnellula hyalina]TVY28740.1 Pescadillo-like protein [Lachnellula hyalina]